MYSYALAFLTIVFSFSNFNIENVKGSEKLNSTPLGIIKHNIIKK